MSAAINTRMSRSDWLLLLALSLLWGGSFALMKVALTALPPLTVVAARVSIAALFLAAALALTGRALPRGWQLWRSFFTMGLWNNVVPWILFAYAQTVISSGLAAILNAATPLVTALVAHALTTDEKLSVLKLAGVLVGMAGVVLIVGPSFLVPAAPGAGLVGAFQPAALAELVCLAATFSYAYSGIYGRRFRRMEVAPMAAAFGQMTAAAAVMISLSLIVDRPWTLPAPGMGPIAALVCAGVVATGLAYIVFYRLLAAAGATNLMLVTFLIPAWALLVGWLAFGETLTVMHAIGIAVVGVGLAVIDGRLVVALGQRLRPLRGGGRAKALPREADATDR